MFLSVLLPTRKRLRWLQESLDSLFESAANPDDIEVLLAMDSDDHDTQKGLAEYLTKYPTVRIVEFERKGYAGLHFYMNGLAAVARGQYFLLWNDDARMVSKRWDEVVRLTVASQDGPYVYQVQNNSGVDVFALVPRQWYEILGHISQVAPYDSWINDIADTLEVNKPIPISAVHFIGDERLEADYVPVPAEGYRIGQEQLFSEEAVRQRRVDIARLRFTLYSDEY